MRHLLWACVTDFIITVDFFDSSVHAKLIFYIFYTECFQRVHYTIWNSDLVCTCWTSNRLLDSYRAKKFPPEFFFNIKHVVILKVNWFNLENYKGMCCRHGWNNICDNTSQNYRSLDGFFSQGIENKLLTSFGIRNSGSWWQHKLFQMLCRFFRNQTMMSMVTHSIRTCFEHLTHTQIISTKFLRNAKNDTNNVCLSIL